MRAESFSAQATPNNLATVTALIPLTPLCEITGRRPRKVDKCILDAGTSSQARAESAKLTSFSLRFLPEFPTKVVANIEQVMTAVLLQLLNHTPLPNAITQVPLPFQCARKQFA